MSFNSLEVERITEVLNEILTETFLKDVHELRKKLTLGDSKLQEQQQKINDLVELVEKLEKCHDCHAIMRQYRSIGTQTEKQGSPPKENNISKEFKNIEQNLKHEREPEVICIDSDDD